MTYQGNSRTVTSNQVGIHHKLDTLVMRYQQTESKRPVCEHTREAFVAVEDWLDGWQGDIILDSCCGVGQSTATIAAAYPDCKVIGLDKSVMRLGKHSHYQSGADNYAVFRADVNDFWRLAVQGQWSVKKHYLLYPNPYPKSSQIQKRWYGCAAMVDLMALCPVIEVRSNWLLYLQEFAQAAKHYGLSSEIETVTKGQPMTPFERKYLASGQTCWVLTTGKGKD